MANRKIDMCEYKNVIQRLRISESDRQISRETKMGRHKVRAIRAAALKRGWLLSDAELPCDEAISELIKKSGNLSQKAKALVFDYLKVPLPRGYFRSWSMSMDLQVIIIVSSVM